MEQRIKLKIEHARKYELGLLELRNAGLTEFPEEILECKQLVNINLGNDDYCPEHMRNRIKNIPPSLKNLTKVSKLDLSNNELRSLDDTIASLKSLEYLHLNGNKLTDIPAKIVSMPSLKKLSLEDNPFEMLPPEIVARGIDSIRNFFKELDEKDYLYEAKLIIVGEGRVGKTCIANALVNPNYKLSDAESTEGIHINRWIIPQHEVVKFNPKIQRDLQINLWDFGGQEIYHSTHQFFLTKRAVYLLVTESRKEDRHDDFYYWLNIIRLLGDNSPVYMVLNKCDQPTKELPIKEYKETFPNIIEFSKISLVDELRGLFTDFKDNLSRIASNLPHIGNPLPKTWVDIRIELESMKIGGKNYISESEYLEICKKNYRKSESALFLSEYFHDLGVMLHFQDDIDLKETVFLNHEWITKGVYKVLDDRQVLTQKGRFTTSDIQRIWNDNEYQSKTRELLSLMKNKKFDLCFELENGDFLVPRLLPVDEIEHDWTHAPENLKFEIHYKFMPKGILTRLIVKMNQDIDREQYWRYGVLLAYDSTKAIVKEKYFENKISIELQGAYQREFLFMIRKAINEIHRDFNQLMFEEMIPCSCKTCSQLTVPNFYSFTLLLRYEQNNKNTIVCPVSLEDVSVNNLTNNVIKGKMTNDKTVVCENKNEALLTSLKLKNVLFFSERDSGSVYMQIKTRPHLFGLRDRDYLLDVEIERLRKLYPNYYILQYYCFENYLYHPENINTLKLEGFSKTDYIKEIRAQKNIHKFTLISNFKRSRDSYQEFRIDTDKVRAKNKEDEIIQHLESDDIEIFFKSFSLKDYYDKKYISKYGLTPKELASTDWFKNQFMKILEI
jgi:small GTP-binding protein